MKESVQLRGKRLKKRFEDVARHAASKALRDCPNATGI